MWDGKLCYKVPSLDESRSFAEAQLDNFRDDYKRLTNPTPYKVSISQRLRTCMKDLIEKEVPVESIE